MAQNLVFDIEKSTQNNNFYREVIYTGDFQLALMSLTPGETIPGEVHPDLDQFIRVESGNGTVSLENDGIINIYPLKDGTAVIIPGGTPHEFKNTGIIDLKLYSIYSKPEHSIGLVQGRQP